MRPRDDDVLDALVGQQVEGGGDGDVGLAGAGRPDAEQLAARLQQVLQEGDLAGRHRL